MVAVRSYFHTRGFLFVFNLLPSSCSIKRLAGITEVTSLSSAYKYFLNKRGFS